MEGTKSGISLTLHVENNRLCTLLCTRTTQSPNCWHQCLQSFYLCQRTRYTYNRLCNADVNTLVRMSPVLFGGYSFCDVGGRRLTYLQCRMPVLDRRMHRRASFPCGRTYFSFLLPRGDTLPDTYIQCNEEGLQHQSILPSVRPAPSSVVQYNCN